jgi:DNA-directed RNA polymerase specialized sigma subunit
MPSTALTRLSRLTQRRARLLEQMAALDEERRRLIHEALAEGHGVRTVGQAADISHGRVSQIARQGLRSERP